MKNFGKEAQLLLADSNIPLGAITALPNDECPGIGLFSKCYGSDAVSWLGMHLGVLNAAVEAKHHMSYDTLRLLAWDIINAHPDLNLGEICVFLARVRQGRYGHFFQSVDNVMIMNWMKTFRKEREAEVDKYEKAILLQQQKEEREAWKKNSISMEEYLEQCRAAGKDTKGLDRLNSRQLFAGKTYDEETAYRLLEEKDEEFIARRDALLKEMEDKINE